MQSTKLPEHLRGFAAANPSVNVRVSITVDPLVIDELKREHAALPITRLMKSKKFRSEEEASRFFASQMLGEFGNRGLDTIGESTAEDNANKLLVQAFSAQTSAERQNKANEALALWPDCAEAYIVLAAVETESAKSLALLQKGMEIASLQLDMSKFEEPDGYFWQMAISRPYMRCRTALAMALWKSGEKRSAIDHFKTLLTLNPYDNQGLRFHLLNWLLDSNANHPEVDQYCTEYEHDHSAFIKYACLLWHFTRHGNSKKSLKALRKALDTNKFVPALLCRSPEIPNISLNRVVRGSAGEAIAYRSMGAGAWQKADNALGWLESNCSTLLSSKTILRQIACAQEFTADGPWMGTAPRELSMYLDEF